MPLCASPAFPMCRMKLHRPQVCYAVHWYRVGRISAVGHHFQLRLSASPLHVVVVVVGVGVGVGVGAVQVARLSRRCASACLHRRMGDVSRPCRTWSRRLATCRVARCDRVSMGGDPCGIELKSISSPRSRVRLRCATWEARTALRVARPNAKGRGSLSRARGKVARHELGACLIFVCRQRL